MRSKKRLVTIISIVTALLVLCAVPITAMTVRLPLAENALIFVAPDPKNSIFTISYLHSVEKSMVQGIFTVGEQNQLLLLETRMESVGTGLPIEANECIGRQGAWRITGGEPMVLPELRFRYHKMNRLSIQYEGKQIPTEDTPDNELMTLQVEKISLARYLFQRLTRLFQN